MTTAIAPAPTRAVLQDRWDAVMEWDRTLGNPTEEYQALASALYDLAVKVAAVSEDSDPVVQLPDDALLFAVGELVIEAVQRLGIAR